MAEFVPVQLKPGIIQAQSPVATPGRWYDGNLVRWIGGNITPVAGWTPLMLSAQCASKIRQVHTWVDNGGVNRTAILCEANLYIVEGSTLIDITPSGGFLGVAPVVGKGGYNTGPYGTGAYSTLRPLNDTYKPIGPAYTLDNWGQTLVAMTSYDGRLLQWDPALGPGNKAVAVSGAPTNNRFFTVTDERHVVLWQYGGNINSFAWCSQENINDWNFASISNTAGFYNIQPSASIVSAVKVSSGVLFFTSDKAYLLNYIGAPYIYNFSPVADAAVPVSNGSVTEYGGSAFWFADNGFWVFNGTTAAPLPCDLQDFLLGDIERLNYRYVCFAVNIQSQNEIWFFYPSRGAVENNRFIMWNFAEGWWSKGMLSRTCGYRASFTAYPLMSDGTKVYQHEKGQVYADFYQLPFAKTSALTTRDGAVRGTLLQMIVDNPDDPANLYYTFTGRNRSRPDLPAPRSVGPKLARVTPDGGNYIDIRLSARDISMTVQSVSVNSNNWSVGIPLVRVAERGKR